MKRKILLKECLWVSGYYQEFQKLNQSFGWNSSLISELTLKRRRFSSELETEVRSMLHKKSLSNISMKQQRSRLVSVLDSIRIHIEIEKTSEIPIQDVSTRWNTLHDMLMRHGELEDTLRMYTGNIELKITDFELIQKITNTLKGFKLITEKLSGSYATMGDLFVLVKSLLLSLADSEEPIFSGIKSFRLTLRDDLNVEWMALRQ
ncbi:hypothetical protein LOD99_14209 [Oopsacas minuta]|uniref:Uncharacterized protein n=1 Tax=Oopsacas minuta TaxID=111878 RepID=A0AAV7KI78_9METZ|nr:hypothetical protein LOD99_14209 [Oopsacas minuta]